MNVLPWFRRFAPIAFSVAAVLASGPGSAHAADVELRVKRDVDLVLVDAVAPDLVDEDVLGALRSGLPARVTWRIELWAQRRFLWDDLVLGFEVDQRVIHRLLEDRFEVFDDVGQLSFSGEDPRAMARWVEELRNLPLCALERLEPDRDYHVSAQVRLEPLTVEELEDLRRWLKGNLETGAQDQGTVERLSGHLLGLVRGQLGLGDRMRRARSEGFRPDDLAEETAARR